MWTSEATADPSFSAGASEEPGPWGKPLPAETQKETKPETGAIVAPTPLGRILNGKSVKSLI